MIIRNSASPITSLSFCPTSAYSAYGNKSRSSIGGDNRSRSSSGDNKSYSGSSDNRSRSSSSVENTKITTDTNNDSYYQLLATSDETLRVWTWTESLMTESSSLASDASSTHRAEMDQKLTKLMLRCHESVVTKAVFSLDGDKMASCEQSGTILFWTNATL